MEEEKGLAIRSDYPVESNILDNPLAEVDEAENALKTTGEKNTGLIPPDKSVEFYYGKRWDKTYGKWIKTDKIYWIYTFWKDKKRKRASPNKINASRIKKITSIENCPYKGRVEEFRRKSLRFEIIRKTTGGTNNIGGFQSSQDEFSRKLDDE